MLSCSAETFSEDALDRQNRLTFADGRSRQSTFDRDSNVSVYTDENGSVSNPTYDALNRLINDSIIRAVGVIGTTLQTFQYEGLGRNTRATDNGDPADAAQSSVVTNVYDSLGRTLEESLQIGATGTVRYTTATKWRAESDRLELTYPNGRQVQPTFDGLGRLKTLKDAAAATPIATWRWVGPGRLLEMAYQNSSCLTHLNDARSRSANQPGYPAETRGFDGVGRITAHRWLQCTLDANGLVTAYVNPGTPLIGFRHAWNVADSKLSQELMHALGDSEAYKYDSASRLIKFDRGTLNAALTDVVTPTTTPGLLQSQIWNLDGPGNWPSTTTTTGGVPTTETRTHNNLNQITAINAVPLTYDSNGNTTDDRDYLHAYDAKNRLRRVSRKSDNVVVGLYAYDALGRRIRRVFVAPGTPTPPAVTVHYYHDGQRVIEEREPDGSGNEVFKRQYTYGLYIDECLTLDRDLNGNGIATDPGERLFYHASTLYSIFALTDANRSQPERYLYDAYGRPLIWSSGADAIYGTGDDIRIADGASMFHNVRLFTGREWDVEATLHSYRARQLSWRLGRFLSRDLSPAEIINAYPYVGNTPTSTLDPTGALGVTSIPGSQILSPNARCGGTAQCDWDFMITVSLRFPPFGAPCDGYIVQKVTYQCDIKPCPSFGCSSSGACPTTLPTTAAATYYEAWSVRKGAFYGTPRGAFTDRATQPLFPGTCGIVKQSGEIKFYCKNASDSPNGVGTGDLKTDPYWWAQTKPPYRTYGSGLCRITPGTLLSTDLAPGWWSLAPVDGPANRMLSAQWKCCGRTSVVYAVASPLT